MSNKIGAGSKLSKEAEDRLCGAGWYEAAQRLLCWWIKCKDFGVRMGKRRLCNRVVIGAEEVVYVCGCNGDGMKPGPKFMHKKRKEKCNI